MKYLSKLIVELERLDNHFSEQAVILASEIFSTIERKSRVFIAGNGGSAATSQHFAIDLISIGKLSKPFSIPVFDLTSNSAAITAVGNDVGFDEVFSAQIERFAKKNDLVIVFSASGSSPNIIKAVEMAKKLELRSFGVVGFQGDSVSQIVDQTFHCGLTSRNYGLVEDIHLSFTHAVTQTLRKQIELNF